MSSALFNKIKRIRGKSWRVIKTRGFQELSCALLRATGGWARLAKKSRRLWTHERAQDWLRARQEKPVILAQDGLEALKEAIRDGQINGTVLQERASAAARRDFEVLNSAVPKNGEWPWHSDWRLNHAWPPQYFKNYDHHAPRDRPYDVKYPWELSRLSFLPRMMQGALLAGDQNLEQDVFSILSDWEEKNPLAFSIVWDPMEAAMRTLSLVFLLDLTIARGGRAGHLALLLRLITVHGEFVRRTVEDTDARGNHYAAEIVALLLAGQALEDFWPRAKEWKGYALARVEGEILSQFLPDGMNFEKATGYHRLVTELFMAASIALEKAGHGLGTEALGRLHKAAVYAAMTRRPDGLCPVVGDTDDAFLFGFDPMHVRDHGAVIALGAVLFGDGRLKSVPLPPSVCWLLGARGLARWQGLESAPLPVGAHFKEGGVAVVKSPKNYLFFDMGEVGQRGLGGHGHNDLLSFELFLEGAPLVVDPGSYMYTGDRAARDLFRSSRSHNGLVVDAAEIAPFQGPFRISNAAKPHSEFCEEQKGIWRLQCGHSGYRRLGDPVDHLREIVFSPASGRFLCKDRVSCRALHKVERFLHLAPGVECEIAGNKAIVRTQGRSWQVMCDRGAVLARSEGRVSPGYGLSEPALIINITNQVDKETELFIDIFPIV